MFIDTRQIRTLKNKIFFSKFKINQTRFKLSSYRLEVPIIPDVVLQVVRVARDVDRDPALLVLGLGLRVEVDDGVAGHGVVVASGVESRPVNRLNN